MNAIQPPQQHHLWDGTPMAAMPYVISKGNDTPDERVYEGMNMSEHTDGKLCVSSKHPRIIKMHDFMGETDVMVASASGMTNSGFFPTDDEAIANARRLVAAWNACDGISTADLEMDNVMFVAALKQRDRLSAINAELLEALKWAVEYAEAVPADMGCNLKKWAAIGRAAIAKAQGEQP